jgi:UDP-N-acetylmuramoylalanine--D-glutamate ligase
MNDANKHIVILGAGESGAGAAILAQKQGWQCFVSDYGTIKPEYQELLNNAEIEFEQGQHSLDRILKADLVIKSPGIADTVAIIKAIEEQNIPIVDEIEFAARYTKAKIIATTGSNGKTTTTLLVHHILKTAGLDVGLAGNVGYSFAKQVAEGDHDYYALEVSSFQLDRCYEFAPDIMIITNITADHLDRYDYKLENYIASKFRLVQNKQPEQTFIYCTENENTDYGMQHYFKQDDKAGCIGLAMNDGGGEDLVIGNFRMPKRDLSLQGRHNYFNMRAAVAAVQQLGKVSNEAICKALASFVNEAHRMESVVTINEVEYINDSKATNVDAVFYALDAMTKPIVWIVGGIDKGNDYSQLFDLVREKVRAIICLGKDNSPIIKAFKPINDWIIETNNMPEAIKVASLYAEAGDVVLLSPACSSFDLFENYKRRGEIFKEILLQQHKILTEGVSVELNVNINMNPTSQKTDENDKWDQR